MSKKTSCACVLKKSMALKYRALLLLFQQRGAGEGGGVGAGEVFGDGGI